jgi:redox-sensitive bicupin YhaK (pirin superfamily)
MNKNEIRIRPAAERGVAEFGWLSSRHSFSFAEYYDPEHMGFRALRVIDDDRVHPGQSFGTHPHLGMEILSIVVAGALEHKDSRGTGGSCRRHRTVVTAPFFTVAAAVLEPFSPPPPRSTI